VNEGQNPCTGAQHRRGHGRWKFEAFYRKDVPQGGEKGKTLPGSQHVGGGGETLGDLNGKKGSRRVRLLETGRPLRSRPPRYEKGRSGEKELLLDGIAKPVI